MLVKKMPAAVPPTAPIKMEAEAHLMKMDCLPPPVRVSQTSQLSQSWKGRKPKKSDVQSAAPMPGRWTPILALGTMG